MAARIEITPARSVVILLYALDDGLRDTSALTDIINGEPGPATGGGQRRANAHARLLAPGRIPFEERTRTGMGASTVISAENAARSVRNYGRRPRRAAPLARA
jgi:hypothetical protein